MALTDPIFIYDEDTIFINSLLSKSDGRFSFLGLRPGNYRAKLDQTQLDYLNLTSDTDSLVFTIGSNTEGDVTKELKFILQPK